MMRLLSSNRRLYTDLTRRLNVSGDIVLDSPIKIRLRSVSLVVLLSQLFTDCMRTRSIIPEFYITIYSERTFLHGFSFISQ